MKLTFLFALLSLPLLILLGSGGVIASDEVEPSLLHSDYLIDQHDDTDNEEPLNEALAILEGLIENHPENPQLLWRLAKAYYYLGWLSQDSVAVWEKGRNYGELAIEKDPNIADAYFWVGALMGEIGLKKGVLNSLFMLKPMRKHLETALELDPNHADAYYALGRLYLEAPGWPLSFGNKQKGVEYLEKAVEINPKDKDYLMHLHQAYITLKRNDDANRIQEMIDNLE